MHYIPFLRNNLTIMYTKLLKKLYLLIIILVSFIFIQFLCAGKSKQNFLDVPRFRSFSCEFSDQMGQFMYSNATCNLTRVDRRVTAISVYIKFLSPVDKLFVSFNFFF